MTLAASQQDQLVVSSFHDSLTTFAAEFNLLLGGLLPLPDGPERRVIEAMRYAALDGGKRLRPFLVSAAANVFEIEKSRSWRAAAAVEFVHCYSLVHDDIPAMDDDDLRRGRPTCHKAFDEATAILAGDGLLTEAFAVLADGATHPDGAVRAHLVQALAAAAGGQGMVGGQMIDLLASKTVFSAAEVEHLQALKTGALLAVSCRFGPILGQAGADAEAAFHTFGLRLGAAFQIADDLLDLEANETEIGKATGKDADAGKATFVSLHGPEHARNQAKSLVDQAVASLDGFGAVANPLRDAARFAIQRRQ
jgi:farnesyl diphosphate synthase